MEQVSLKDKKAVLFLAGVCLIIIQFVMIRNFSSLLFGTEMIILLVTLSYFLGISLGYHFSDRVSRGFLEGASLFVLFLHLTLPFSPRYIAGALMRRDNDLAALAVLIFAGSFLISSFYSILLPRFVQEEGTESLSDLYRYEILGALAGISILFAASHFVWGAQALMTVYFGMLSAILWLLWRSKALAANCVFLTLFYAAVYPYFEKHSVAFYYQTAKFPDGDSRSAFKPRERIRTVFTADTPYQRVEIIEGDFQRRQLYLDGIRHFGDDSLSDFNMYIAGLPASFMKSPSVLIVGSGSLGSLYQVLKDARSVDTVEIDRAVIRAGAEHLSNEHDHALDPILKTKWILNIDDAKHFIVNSPKTYDLVVMDIAGPLQMQVSLLYTLEFYELVRQKLSDQGLVAVSLNGELWKSGTVTCRILKTLRTVFNQCLVVGPYDDSNFAFAGNRLAFGKKDLEKELARRKTFKTRVFNESEIDDILSGGDYPVISHKKMDLVLNRTWRRLMTQYFDYDD